MSSARRSPLHEWHSANGAQFIDLYGWQVPNQYAKPEIEYAALRNGAAFSDLWHHSRFRIEGDDSIAYLNELLTVNVASIPMESCASAYMCNERGGIIDLFSVYRDRSYVLLMGNCSARMKAFNWLQQQAARLEKYRVEVADVSSGQGQIAVRGPGALLLVERLCFGQDIGKGTGEVTLATIGTARCLVIGSSYGPVKGFDLIAGSLYVVPIWEKLLEAARATGARAIGHAAHEILRVESGCPSIGMDTDDSTTPIEINDAAKVDFHKNAFVGRRALMHSTSGEMSRLLVPLKFEGPAKVSPEAEILYESIPVGRVTSVTNSPVTRGLVALGYMNSYKAIPGVRVSARGDDGQLYPCEVAREQ
ncbi:aminomethyl transferase family protein [Candidatus Sumerlaeota bacterium]|nr:aminomethyl transferase family protein [Candidatus Sumerlaeota bacterium]